MGAVPFLQELACAHMLIVSVCVHVCACIKCVPEVYMSCRADIFLQTNRLYVMLAHLLYFRPSFVDKTCLCNARQARNWSMNCVHLRRL